MSDNANDVRRAHNLLDDISIGNQPDQDDLNHLRSFLPEMPKQKTLEEIAAHVYDAWLASSDYEFNGNEYDPDVTIEDWLLELHKQLKGVEVTAPAHPEFLETEADYRDAPVGTVAIREGGYPWTRIFDSWVAYSRNDYSHSEMAALRGKARVLRWAVGNEKL